jgi:transposase-like protein
MAKCKSCGKEHKTVLEDRITGKYEPLDACYQCIFKNYKPRSIEYTITIDGLDNELD